MKVALVLTTLGVMMTQLPLSMSVPQQTCAIEPTMQDLANGLDVINDPTCVNDGAGCILSMCRYCRTSKNALYANLIVCPAPSGKAVVPITPPTPPRPTTRAGPPPTLTTTCSYKVSVGDAAVGIDIVADAACQAGGLGCLPKSVCRLCKRRDTAQSKHLLACQNGVLATPEPTSHPHTTKPVPPPKTQIPTKPTTPAPTPKPTTRAPAAKPTTPAPTPKPTTRAPTPKPTTRAPAAKPTTPAPTPKPTTRAPTPKPTTRAPTPKPTTRVPAAKPTTPAPTPKPTTRAPTHKPTTRAPTPKPTTRAPTAKPTTRTPTPKPTTRVPSTTPSTFGVPAFDMSCTYRVSSGDARSGLDVITDVACFEGGLGCVRNACRLCKRVETSASRHLQRCDAYKPNNGEDIVFAPIR